MKKFKDFNETIRNFIKIYKYNKNTKKNIIKAVIIDLIIIIIYFLYPLVIAKSLLALSNNKLNILLIMVMTLFVIDSADSLLKYLFSIIFNKINYQIKKNLQLELISESLKIKQSTLNQTSSGILIERINNDTSNLAKNITNLLDLLMSLLGRIGLIFAICVINIYVGLLYVFFIVIVLLFNNYSYKINYKNNQKQRENRDKTGGFVSEIIKGTKDIKILNAEKSFLNKTEEYIDDTNKINYEYEVERKKLYSIMLFIKALGDFASGLLIIFLIYKNELTTEAALILYNYSSSVQSITYTLSNLSNTINDFNLSCNRIFGLLGCEEFPKEKFGNKNISKFKGHIEFKDVNFSYEENIPVLKNLNLEVLPNEVVGFVGPSGAGKSTIFNLISALNKPDSGEILFDGESINELTKDSIRGNLSVISQNAYIFNMSIEDNLRIIKKNATKKEIEKACKMACLDEFIESLPNKYKTIVGEGGVTLSGGQRQRIAIARALLLNTEVLLFDEATSSLDNTTQEKIQKAIENLKGKYTILIIAHRLSTVINSDKIYVINKGTVAGVGTHKELLKTCKTYADLYKNEDNKID